MSVSGLVLLWCYSRMCWGPELGFWAEGSHSQGCSVHRSHRQLEGWRQSSAAGCLPVEEKTNTQLELVPVTKTRTNVWFSCWNFVATQSVTSQFILIELLTWNTSSSSRRAPNTVMPLVSTTALLPLGRGRVIFFLQSSSSVTFFLETEKAMRCHLQTRRRNHRQFNEQRENSPK